MTSRGTRVLWKPSMPGCRQSNCAIATSSSSPRTTAAIPQLHPRIIRASTRFCWRLARLRKVALIWARAQPWPISAKPLPKILEVSYRPEPAFSATFRKESTKLAAYETAHNGGQLEDVQDRRADNHVLRAIHSAARRQ